MEASEIKTYRVGLCKVIAVKWETNVFVFKRHDKVSDGVNVSNVYKIESNIANIKWLLLRVDLN